PVMLPADDFRSWMADPTYVTPPVAAASPQDAPTTRSVIGLRLELAKQTLSENPGVFERETVLLSM
uniref:hypothetical protein n=1 Tax=Enterobacter agglomerans TaxID=549 RepID=UPI001CA3C926